VVRRKGNRFERAGGSFALVEAEGVEKGIDDYEAVYARSWKEPEPFPLFQPTLMRALARAGWLRLALCHIEGRPVAAQLWVVVGGRATVLKLAHDKEFDRLSPGTLLTAFAIRALMERDRIRSLDFGRGDDAYKRAWTSRRTPHIGVLWTSLAKRPVMAARHLLGELLRRRRGGPVEAEDGG
jgi:CelD/BcsL family acetyltransferase involved in cellulose biosynthesis